MGVAERLTVAEGAWETDAVTAAVELDETDADGDREAALDGEVAPEELGSAEIEPLADRLPDAVSDNDVVDGVDAEAPTE